MLRICKLSSLTLVILSAAASTCADGMMVRPLSAKEWARNRERAMINEPEQKAVVYFEKGKQQLIISPSFEGAPAEFAWIIPVPSRPNVQILDGALFHELARLTMPRPPAANGRGTKGAAGAAVPTVEVIERKTVGAYDVSVLSAADGGALTKWLQNNGYRIPDRARNPIGQYVKERWTFVACRVKNPGSASGLRSGTLAPIRLTFKTPRPVYPMRISSANPAPFGVLIYLVLPNSESGGYRGGIINLKRPGSQMGQGTHWVAALAAHSRRAYPTLGNLSREQMDVYVVRDRLRPEDSNRDYVWRTKTVTSAR